MINFSELYRIANKARQRAYAPYSKITVGAALLCESGKIYTGANIENAAYSPSVCAERVAVFNAVNSGERGFRAIAVAGGKEGEAPMEKFPPCGVCRQVMGEFCKEDFIIIFGENTYATLSEIMPFGFDGDNIK